VLTIEHATVRAARHDLEELAVPIVDVLLRITQLAIGAAEVIVQHNLDRATQVQLVESYIEQVLSRSN